MLAFLIRRLFQWAIVLLVVDAISFGMFPFKGDPVNHILVQERTQVDVDQLRDRLGLAGPFVVQYTIFLQNAARGDFGVSYRQGRPVADNTAEPALATPELAFVSGVKALVIGIALGLLTAIKRESRLSSTIMTLSLVGVSLPAFLIGILLIYVFSVQLDWMPSFGRGETVRICGWTTGFLTKSGLIARILSLITLGLY